MAPRGIRQKIIVNDDQSHYMYENKRKVDTMPAYGHLRRNDMLLTAKTSVVTNKVRENLIVNILLASLRKRDIVGVCHYVYENTAC
jgi:hypothetical protein